MTKIIRKAFKYRLKPTPEHSQKMNEYAGTNRFVWNKALALNLDRLNAKQPLIWYQELAFWLTLWKRSTEYTFLSDAPSQSLQQTLKQLTRAFSDGFDKTQPVKRIPTFKRKGVRDSFTYPQGVKLKQAERRIFLPKIGWVAYRYSRPIVGEIKNCTISRRGEHWYVSIQTEYEVEEPIHTSSSIVGLDLGVARFATLSTGEYIEPINAFKQLERKLARLQKSLSRKVKFSSNWRKVKTKLSRLHERIANTRQDFLNKVSNQISKNHAVVVVEDLKVKNMSRSAKGTVITPGKHVKAKSGLNKSILDQGWSSFVSMLIYKQDWLGGEVIKVDPRYTSQTCPACQHVSSENRRSQSVFSCVKCGYENNADYVGANTILARGHRVLACGVETVVTTLKQEPFYSESVSIKSNA
jgi:putative transposase